MARAYSEHRQKVESILAEADKAGLLRYISPAELLQDVKAMPGGECVGHHNVSYWTRQFKKQCISSQTSAA
ncbi:hypothetical protein H6F75_00340 [Nodosilinea sp. FACHB-131]|uniref:hypothetical protein n=1 Tax=Cyanophyceae TaxID=3028117 RepID=UPI001684CEA5|nr:hypothetical protein [Nodosilinea sp. FACHB-131]MBD1871918.1 hypothetical protein [Nodosilinea sp. FACHB-131]